jgi:NADH:ubiquinone oxidoreductase subunit
MKFLRQLFIWWHGQTLGTRLFTWRQGSLVGTDGQGNRYYQDRKARRRWVIYNGEVEASRVPAEWHGWLHYTVDLPPDRANYPSRSWFKPHQPNLTGSLAAYRPAGSLLGDGQRAAATGDYEAWKPE